MNERSGDIIFLVCGRYVLRRVDRISTAFQVGIPELFEEFSETRKNPLRARYNIAPGQYVAVVRINAKGDRVLGIVKWGLIPSWTVGKPKLQPINARAETIATSSMFKQAFQRRRCLVPADGFYEPKGPPVKRGQPARPQYFFHRVDDEPFAFAGIWERWTALGADKPIDTMTILTTASKGAVSSIHDRMPVILAPADYARWLDRGLAGQEVMNLVGKSDIQEVNCHRVSETILNTTNENRFPLDVPACIAPL